MPLNSGFSPITLGRPVRTFDLDGLILTESIYSPFQVLPPHAHELATLSLVRRGSFVEVSRRNSQECDPLSLLVEPPGEVHSDQFGPEGALCFHLSLKPQLVKSIPLFSRLFNHPQRMRAAGLAALGVRIEQELSLMDEASPVAVQGLLFELLARTVRSGPRNSTSPPLSPWLRQARDLIHADFTSELRLQSIADLVGVHPCHLAKAFRKHFSHSVGDYLRRVRVDNAIQLMT